MTENALVPQASNTAQAAKIAAEAARRRTFAVISHPDAGKSTLTEALALHARVITEAGAIHGKAGRRSTVSDWMDMEKARGISITSTALQFPYRDCVINLLDTPGHADFSEDTYRVLTAVDCAVMLIDAAKGLEPQTLKLFQVCKHRGIPIITVINKWDRPGRHALELMDEIHERIGLRTTPLTWPVGIAGDFKGVMDRRAEKFIRFTRTAGGATAAPEEHIAAADAHAAAGDDWDTAVEESELLASRRRAFGIGRRALRRCPCRAAGRHAATRPESSHHAPGSPANARAAWPRVLGRRHRRAPCRCRDRAPARPQRSGDPIRNRCRRCAASAPGARSATRRQLRLPVRTPGPSP